MWERKIKNKSGCVEDMAKEDEYTYLNGTSYKKGKPYDAADGIKYHVEYMRNEQSEYADKADRGEIHKYDEKTKEYRRADPWEFRDEYDTDSLGQAFGEVMYRLFDPNTENVWMWMTVDDREINMELPVSVIRPVRELIKNGINKQLETKEREIDVYKQEAENMRRFIKHANAETLYKEWLKGELQ